MSRRERALDEARRWIGTPYQHQASCQGGGCDCLGLVRGVWRSLYGQDAEAVPPYSRDWRTGGPDLLAAASRHLEPVPAELARAGDVLLFRPVVNGPVKHCAIASSERTIIHAYWGRCVCETALTRWWRRRLAAAFAFPEHV